MVRSSIHLTPGLFSEGYSGTMEDSPGTYANISLSWPTQEQGHWDDPLRLDMYHSAACRIVRGLLDSESLFQNSFFLRALTAFDADKCLEEEVLEDFRRFLFVSYLAH